MDGPTDAGTQAGLLVIGSSQAGVQLAVSLRALGHDGPITLLGDENHRPYQRPALSKDFLQGKITKESLIFRTEEYWAEHGVAVLKNERVMRLEHKPDGSGTAHTLAGTELGYDRLALCLGARARRLMLPGADLPGVLYLRNADDALELKARVPTARDVVVIGGGFIGIEAAASLTQLGLRVTLLEAGSRLLERATGPETSAFLLAHHRAAGIDIRLGSTADAIVPRGDRVGGVRVGDEVLPADIVLVGIGVVPNTELAESIGLDCANGIVVDRYAVASDGHTLAVGDVANLPNPVPGSPPGDRVRFESVNNAVEQAKAAAYAVVGRPEEYQGIPWFWSDQGALKLQIAGLSSGYDRTVVRQDQARGKFSVLYYRQGRVIAVDAVNTPLDFMAVKNALTAGATIPPDEAADPAVMLKSITRPA